MIRSAELVIRCREARVCVGGVVDAESAAAFAEALICDAATLAGGDRLELDLDELELRDGAAVAEAVNALRELARQRLVVVRHAPQLLAHTLYKAGLLASGRIVLEVVRQEEATSS